MKKVYNKLVRDNIPEIIKNNGETPEIKILDDDEYYQNLKIKLIEETNEYVESDDINEIADILEVVNAIVNYKNSSMTEVENIRNKKLLRNGGFEKRIFLTEVDEK